MPRMSHLLQEVIDDIRNKGISRNLQDIKKELKERNDEVYFSRLSFTPL